MSNLFLLSENSDYVSDSQTLLVFALSRLITLIAIIYCYITQCSRTSRLNTAVPLSFPLYESLVQLGHSAGSLGYLCCFKFINFDVHECFAYMYVYVPYVCLVPGQVRRGCQIS